MNKFFFFRDVRREEFHFNNLKIMEKLYLLIFLVRLLQKKIEQALRAPATGQYPEGMNRNKEITSVRMESAMKESRVRRRGGGCP